MGESEVVVDYGKCSSNKDLISQVSWNDEAPSIFINLVREPGKPGVFNCYNSENLREWLKDNSNYLTEWVPKPGHVMDKDGRGGMPLYKNGQGPLYVKLYTSGQNVYLFVNNAISDIIDGVDDFVIYEAKYIGKKRLGNLQGTTLIVSSLHGQAPGEDVYSISWENAQITKGHEEYQDKRFDQD